MHKVIQKQKNDIRMSFYSGVFKKTIMLCKLLVNKLKKIYYDRFSDIKQEICFCYYYQSKAYQKLRDIKQSIRYAKKAIKFGLNKYNEENYLITEARILLAENYEEIMRTRKSFRNYQECSRFYRSIDCNDNRRQIIFKMARLRKKPGTMLKIISMAELENNNELNESITEKYIDLINYYFKESDINKIISIICDIKDIQIRMQVANSLPNLIPQIA